MKYKYLLAAFLAGALGQQAQAQTTAWRPFRPGFVYAFAQAASPNTLHTLRVDSAYATAGGDSVYTFNRLMRRPSPTSNGYLKSHNNLLGARLRWQSANKDYYLEANAEPTLGGPATPTALLLKPRAAVGSIWTASTSPALTATLSSRTLGAVGSSPDSIATISLSNGQAIVLSRSYGLVSGPQWLSISSTSSTGTWQQPMPPQPGLGIYDPRALVNLNVGDELGYRIEDLAMFSPACYMSYRLRRIVSRTLTTDSLFITYRQQDLVTTYTWPSCGSAPSAGLSAVKQGRWAFSLRTGKSPQFPYLGLLTGEHRAVSSYTPAYVFYMAQALAPPSGTVNCLTGTQQLSVLMVYGSPATSGVYGPGLDQAYTVHNFSTTSGAGLSYSQQGGIAESLVYYRRNGVACGSPTNFSTLLPSRAAEAAAAATLHPNPAAEAATLTLAAPTRPGTVLTLTDALGRRVWSREVAASQTSLPVALAGQPAGLYLVQLVAPGAAPLTWKLNH